MFIFSYGILVDPLLRNLRSFAVEFSGVKTGDRAVDVCCGTGAQVLEFARHGIIAAGVDNNQAMLRIATRNKTKQKISNASFLLADAIILPFPDHFFDCGAVTFGLHDKEKPIRYQIVSELVRTVKQGGNLVLMDFRVPLPRNKWAMIARVLEFLVGGTHYRGFKEYLESGGLETVLKVHNFREVRRAYLFGGLLTAVKVINISPPAI